MRSSEARASELRLNGSRSKARFALCQVLWLSFVHLLFLFVLTHALPPQEIVCERPFTLNQTLISLLKSETDSEASTVGGNFLSKPCLEQKFLHQISLLHDQTKALTELLFSECYSPQHFRLFILSLKLPYGPYCM